MSERSAAVAPERSLRRAARGSMLNLFGSAVGAAATFALAVAITRLSTAAEAGVFFSATSLFLIATSLGRLGTNTGLVYFISGARAKGEPGKAAAYMRMATAPVMGVALLTAIALVVWAAQLGQWLSPGEPEAFATYMRAMALFVPVAALANLAAAGSQGLGTMKVYAILDQMLRPTAQLVLVVAVLLIGEAARSVSLAWAAAYLPFAVVGWLWWRRLRERLDPSPAKVTAVSRMEFWKFTAPRALASVSQVAMQRLDIVLVGALASLPAAAVYAATTRFLVLGQMAGRAISLSIQPLLGGALARADLADARNLYQTCTAWLVMGVWPFYLLLIAFAPAVLAIFGEEYVEGSAALVLLCGAMLFATLCGTVDMVLNMAGKSLWNLVNVLIAFSVFLSLDLWLIPEMGFMGAAIGWAAAIMVANLLPLLQVLRTPGIHPFGGAVALTVLANLVCFGLAPWLGRRVLGEELDAGVAVVAAGLLAYVVFLVRARRVLRLDLLRRAIRRDRGRTQE